MVIRSIFLDPDPKKKKWILIPAVRIRKSVTLGRIQGRGKGGTAPSPEFMWANADKKRGKLVKVLPTFYFFVFLNSK